MTQEDLQAAGRKYIENLDVDGMQNFLAEMPQDNIQLKHPEETIPSIVTFVITSFLLKVREEVKR